MSVKFFLYVIVTILVIWALDAVNINHIFKKNRIVITGHANFADYGRDIVCASASSIVITSINACLRFNKNSLVYEEDTDKLIIDIKDTSKSIKLIIDNMIFMLEELAQTYKKNIKIVKEEDR